MIDDGTIPFKNASVTDLLEVYRALDACKVLLMGAVDRAELSVIDDGEVAVRARKQLLIDEEELIDDRLHALIAAIRSAPVQSRMDAIQKLRFDLSEYGGSADCANPTIREFISKWEPSHA